MHNKVIRFWFVETSFDKWFQKDDNFDQLIRIKFWNLYNDCVDNQLNDWQRSAMSCLSLIIILDQFSRNLFRNSAKAYDQDFKALKICYAAIENNYIEQYDLNQTLFSLLPLVHSENLESHLLAEKMCKEFLINHPNYDFISKSWHDHKLAIEKFGRYPHRCGVFGLKNTKEEKLYLSGSNSSW
ncbi:MAG: DUF924 domain-containing protein [Paracoccaceae bacterium]|nr:DUF924 domain-containing protein [Paracoccaceae bacterium]